MKTDVNRNLFSLAHNVSTVSMSADSQILCKRDDLIPCLIQFVCFFRGVSVFVLFRDKRCEISIAIFSLFYLLQKDYLCRKMTLKKNLFGDKSTTNAVIL